MEILGNYVAAAPESSHVFSFPAIDWTIISELMLIFELSSTLATTALGVRINTIASGDYFTDGQRIINGVTTPIDLNGATSGEILNTGLTGANVASNGILHFVQSLTENVPTVFSKVLGFGGYQDVRVVSNVSNANLTDIEILTLASTWKTLGRMTLYQLRRAVP